MKEKKKPVRLKDIADELGISVVTVSNALNNRSSVSQKMQKIILQKAREMGYQKRSANWLDELDNGGKDDYHDMMNLVRGQIASGIKEIAFSDASEGLSHIDRYLGYRAAMEEAGLRFDDFTKG